MTPSEIGRLVRQLQNDTAFRTSVLAGDMAVLQREGYSVDETERMALCALGSEVFDTALTTAEGSRPWYWAIPSRVEYVARFEEQIVAGQEASYEAWFLRMARHICGRPFRGQPYLGMVLLRSVNNPQKYRWAVDWLDFESAQDFVDSSAADFFINDFPQGVLQRAGITPANFRNQIEIHDMLDEVDAQTLLQVPGQFVRQEEWILNDAGVRAAFVTAQMQRMTNMRGFATFRGGLVEQGRGGAQNRFVMITGFELGPAGTPAQHAAQVGAQHPFPPPGNFGAGAPVIEDYIIIGNILTNSPCP
jgi:hypothetical protein